MTVRQASSLSPPKSRKSETGATPVLRKMQRLLIITTNGALLALLLIGVPAVAGRRLGNWELLSVSASQMLTFWGLALAAAGNGAAARFLIKGRKDRKYCWEWAAVFAALLGIEYAFVRGWLDFHWLQRALLWLQHLF